jgi:hypothetical protein
MAGIPLNTFKTYRTIVRYLDPGLATPPVPYSNQSPYYVYQAPPGTTGIVLYMQIANTDPTATYTASAWHYRLVTTTVPVPTVTPTWTNIVKNVSCPTNDSRIMLGGKLVLETGDYLFVSGNDITATSTSGYLQLIASILESANQ